MDVSEAFSGRLSVRRVVGLVERLSDEPWSRYRARLLGGENWRQHLGWGPSEYLTAHLFDAVQVNTAVTAAHGSKKRPKIPEPYPRPETVSVDSLSAASLDDLDLVAIAALINN